MSYLYALIAISLLLPVSLLAADSSDVAATAIEEAVKIADSAAVVDTVETGPRFAVSMGRIVNNNKKLQDTLDVVVESFGNEFAGFVLKFGIDSRFLDILEILPGEIIDSCNWELFRPVRTSNEDRPELPAVIWKVTALAKWATGASVPLCYGLERPASLMRLVVSRAHVVQVPDTTVSIFFFWEDCRDNVLSGERGDILLISREVLDFYPVDLLTSRDIFPTRFGTPRQCVNPKYPNAPVRAINFHNGGVEFRLEMGDSLIGGTDNVDIDNTQNSND